MTRVSFSLADDINARTSLFPFISPHLDSHTCLGFERALTACEQQTGFDHGFDKFPSSRISFAFIFRLPQLSRPNIERGARRAAFFTGFRSGGLSGCSTPISAILTPTSPQQLQTGDKIGAGTVGGYNHSVGGIKIMLAASECVIMCNEGEGRN